MTQINASQEEGCGNVELFCQSSVQWHSTFSFFFFHPCFTCRHWNDAAGIKDFISGQGKEESVAGS